MPRQPEEIRIFNQAMMELGATVCVPNGPAKCDMCPAEAFCLAKQRGTVTELPVKTPKKDRRVEERTVFILLQDGKVALRQRGGKGLLAGLWEFPNTEGRLEETAVYSFLEEQGLRITDWKKQVPAKHIFTHVEWHMTGYVLSVVGSGPEEFLWADRERWENLAIPSAFARYRQEAEEYFKR